MKQFVIVIFSLFFLAACSEKEPDLEGNWKMNDLIFYDKSDSEVELAGLLWLNILSKEARIGFQNDSIFVDNRFQSTYSLEGQVIHYQDKNGDKRTFDYTFSKDTLILLSPEERLLMKLLTAD